MYNSRIKLLTWISLFTIWC